MLGGVRVVSRDEVEERAATEKRAKKKHSSNKKKKEKKEKRDKHEGKGSHRVSSSDEERSEAPAPNSAGLVREDWMTTPAPAAAGPPASDKAPKESQREDPDAVKIHARELNPYLRDGGSGVPEEGEPPPPRARGVADGGASWRLKALQRAKAAAAAEGKDFRAEVAERWGSVAELTTGLQSHRAAHGSAHLHAARDRSRASGGGDRPGRGRGDYLDDVRSDRSQMKRPTDAGAAGLSWRKEQRDGAAGSAQRQGPAGRDGVGGRSASAAEAAPQRGPLSPAERPGGAGKPGSDRAPSGGPKHEARVQRPSRPPLRHAQQAELLSSAARALNAFADDGSFMAGLARGGDGGGGAAPAARQNANSGLATARSETPGPRSRTPSPSPLAPARPAPTPVAPERPPAAAGNLGAAAALRARLLGRPLPAAVPEGVQGADAVEALPLVDARGRAVPGAFGREVAGAGAVPAGKRPARKLERYEAGQRSRYFADDDAADLATLVKRAKHGGEADLDRSLAAGIARSARYKATDLDPDAEYDHDAGLELMDRTQRKRGDAAQQAQRDKARQVREFGRAARGQERCGRCFTSVARQRHLALAVGQGAYLALPPRGRLVPGHCQILPMEHVPSTRQVDETVWTELRNFKKCLIQMNMQQGMECIFFETALRLGDPRSHAVVECVPIPMELAGRAPMVFKKAIDDATSEWAQHHAKRFIDTRAKGLRGSIPENFAYLHVEFGLSAGFVHVVDDESTFDASLARSVLIGLLGLPEADMHRKAKAESQTLQERWAREFRAEFDAFDWTKMLD
ncbi:hypothetical protein ACKKBG_A06645 [Auxenochlorella protothecoides x Auxenochlorella symbiontica]